jgi:hypothetical protein
LTAAYSGDYPNATTKTNSDSLFCAVNHLGRHQLKNAYGSYTERTNTDVSRASHVITKAGGYEYIYTVDQKLVTSLKADAWSYTLYCVAAFGVGAILWGLTEIAID